MAAKRATKAPEPFDVNAFLASAGLSRRVTQLAAGTVVFAQGAAANTVFYIQDGTVKLSVLSAGGKEAVVAMLGPGEFFGEGCLAGQTRRMGSATAMIATTVLRIPKREMMRTLHEQSTLSDRFIAHVLARNIRIEEDLVDQLFNSSEKRLARTLLLLARYGQARHRPAVVAQVVAGDARGNGRHHALARQFLHEQVSQAGIHRLRRRPEGEDQQLPPQRRPARLTTPGRTALFTLEQRGPALIATIET